MKQNSNNLQFENNVKTKHTKFLVKIICKIENENTFITKRLFLLQIGDSKKLTFCVDTSPGTLIF